MKPNYHRLDYTLKYIKLDTIQTEFTENNISEECIEENDNLSPVNEPNKTVLQKILHIFFVLVFATAALVSLPVSLVLVAVIFPFFVLFKTPKTFATLQISKIIINLLLS